LFTETITSLHTNGLYLLPLSGEGAMLSLVMSSYSLSYDD